MTKRSSTASTTMKCRHCLTHRTPKPQLVCAIGQCCTWPIAPGFGSRNWSGSWSATSGIRTPIRCGVTGKGRRKRTLPLWKETSAVLRDWLAIRPAVEDDHVFLNARGAPNKPPWVRPSLGAARRDRSQDDAVIGEQEDHAARVEARVRPSIPTRSQGTFERCLSGWGTPASAVRRYTCVAIPSGSLRSLLEEFLPRSERAPLRTRLIV